MIVKMKLKAISSLLCGLSSVSFAIEGDKGVLTITDVILPVSSISDIDNDISVDLLSTKLKMDTQANELASDFIFDLDDELAAEACLNGSDYCGHYFNSIFNGCNHNFKCIDNRLRLACKDKHSLTCINAKIRLMDKDPSLFNELLNMFVPGLEENSEEHIKLQPYISFIQTSISSHGVGTTSESSTSGGASTSTSSSSVGGGVKSNYKKFQDGYNKVADTTQKARGGALNTVSSFLPGGGCLVAVFFLGYEEPGDDDYPFVPACMRTGKVF